MKTFRWTTVIYYTQENLVFKNNRVVLSNIIFFERPEVPAVLSLRSTFILGNCAATSHRSQNLEITAAIAYTELLYLKDHVAWDFTLQIFRFAENWDKRFSILYMLFSWRNRTEGKLNRSLASPVAWNFLKLTFEIW